MAIRIRAAAAAAAARHRHLLTCAHVRREQRQVLKEHTLFAFAYPKSHRGRNADVVSFLRLRHHRIRQGEHASCRRIRCQFFWTHERLCEIARGPLGIGFVFVARDGAEDDVRSCSNSFFLELFSLGEVFLSCKTSMSFPC
jgi:hypothetical protein